MMIIGLLKITLGTSINRPTTESGRRGMLTSLKNVRSLVVCGVVGMFIGLASVCAQSTESLEPHSDQYVILRTDRLMEWRRRFAYAREVALKSPISTIVQADDLWRPSQKDIDSMEKILKGRLEQFPKAPPSWNDGSNSYVLARRRQKNAVDLKAILEHYDEFACQYLGIIKDGEKLILRNSFPRIAHPDFSDEKLVYVADGGFWYWRLLYSTDDKEIRDISINGSVRPLVDRSPNTHH